MKLRLTRLLPLLAAALVLCLPDLHAQKHSSTSAHTTFDSISMTGYQGWFGAPGDGGTNGWRHYNSRDGFRPGAATIEYWPDMREAEEDEKYPTEFTFDDGTPATVFSSVNPKTVNRHFQWMKEYGIDGAFVQRFRSDFGIRRVLSQVMLNAVEAAQANDRAIAVMYDFSGTNIFVNGSDEATVDATRTQIVNQIFDDWKEMVDELQLTTRGDDQPYLYHNGKPLVALWGLGFPSRHNPMGIDMDFWFEIVDKFENDPEYGGCSIMFGVPTRWRTGGGDALSGTEHDRMISLIRQSADVVMPWHTSRFGRPDMPITYRNLVRADVQWCEAEGLDYSPTVSPGIREFLLNLNNYERPRDGGLYFWDMARAALEGGAKSLYLGMFDEVDEGTQYFKINNNPPFYSNTLAFTDYGNNPEDHYLWLAGEATRALRGEFDMASTFRERADDTDFQSEIQVTDTGTDYQVQLGAPADGREVYYADPYTVPDGAPTVGVQRDSSLFDNRLTDTPASFPADQRGKYLRFLEVDAATGEVISYRAIVAVHGYATVPYTTSFETEKIDPQFWTTGTENGNGLIATTAEYEPKTGDRQLISTTNESGATSTNYADLHLDMGGITTDVILNLSVKTLGSPTGASDGIYFSNDGGDTYTQVANFQDASNTYIDYSLNVNDLAEAAELSFSETFAVRIQHRATGLNEEGGLVVDDVSLQFSTEKSGFAQFVGTDEESQGAWMGTYGVDGSYIAGKPSNLPDYASITWSPNSYELIWEDASTDVRGLQYLSDSTVLSARTADTDQHPWSYTIDVGDTESNVYMYFLDEVDANRRFILSIVDAATGDRYDVRTIQDFSNGKWVGWKIRGEVTFMMDLLDGPGAIVSGIFFAPSAPEEIIVADYLSFDGLDDFVDCGREEVVQLSGNTLTLESWFKIDTGDTRAEVFRSTVLAMDHSEPGNDQGYFLRASGAGQIGWGFGDGMWHEVNSEPSVQLFEPGVWNHVAGTYDGTTQKIYLNGNLILTSEPFTATVGVAPLENLYIGSSPAFSDRVFNGGLAEVRIWNTARTASEIKEFSTQRITGAEPGLVAYWPIDEGEGQIITDLSTNALTGILGGTDLEDEFDPLWTEGDLGPTFVDALEGFNGSFEDDLMFWRFFEVPNSLGSTVEIITGDVVDGAKAAKVTWAEPDASLGDRALDSWDSNMPLEPNVEYFGSFWAKTDDGDQGTLAFSYGFFDENRMVLGEGGERFTLTDTYQKFEFNYIPPEGTAKGWLSFRWRNEDGTEFRAGVIYIDQIQLLTEDKTVSTGDPEYILRNQTILKPNYPNPFSGVTTIGFKLPNSSPVNLSVIDVSGRQVAVILNQHMSSGLHEVRWNASNLSGGTYYLVLKTNATVRTGKMIIQQ